MTIPTQGERAEVGRRTSAPGRAAAAGRSTILAYHEISPEFETYLYNVMPSLFEEHLKVLAELRAGAASPEAATARVTFDDGHVSIYQNALPLLKRYGVSATVFVTVGWANQRADYMNWMQLREMIEHGHRVQSHGWSHKFLTLCTDAELRDELRRSKRTLEDHLGQPVEEISLPGGRWNHRALAAAADAGYRRVYLSAPWDRLARKNGVEVLGRLMMRGTMDAKQLRRWLLRTDRSLALLAARERLKQTLRRVLGESAYHRLWCWLAGWKKSQHPRSI